MTDEKPEFDVKGFVNELVTDNGPSFLRANYKSKYEQDAAQKKQLELARNSSHIGSKKK